MKTLLIVALVILLCAGAFLSKPSQSNFVDFIKTQTQPAQPQSLTGLGKQILGGILTKANEQQMVYHDHGLWATEEQGGQTMYYGVFSRWFKAGAASTTAAS